MDYTFHNYEYSPRHSKQLFHRPDYPTADFLGKTLIVTRCNVGLGKEIAKLFVCLKAVKVMIAISSTAKDEERLRLVADVLALSKSRA